MQRTSTKLLQIISEKGSLSKVGGELFKDGQLDIQRVKKGTSLALYKKTNGEEATLKNIAHIIKYATEQLKIEQPSTGQIIQMASDLLSDFILLKFEDLVACFRNGVQGRYGKIYNRLDIMIIYEWMGQYQKEKEELLYHDHMDKTLSTRGVNPEWMDNLEKATSYRRNKTFKPKPPDEKFFEKE